MKRIPSIVSCGVLLATAMAACGCAPASPTGDSGAPMDADASADAAVSADAPSPGDAPSASDAASAGDVVARVPNSPGSAALLAALRAMNPRNEAAYNDAIAAGVTITPTSDGLSFFAYWAPAGFAPATGGIVVSLHGHDGFVATAFSAWRPYLEQRGYAFLALQWWFGGGEAISDYYLPGEMMPLLNGALDAHGVPPGRALFEGFSRGSSNSYALTALDRASRSPRFIATISNAGSAELDYGPTAEVDSGRFGATPFAGVPWMFYCGRLDTETGGGCDPMRATEAWVVRLGARSALFIDDPLGMHGGFHQHPANANAALDVYRDLLGAL